mmetsp:Transcript_47032/g.77824  ORF Transcript_47032/g.77824 Transcript_47032/m.77824 type:complete len:126 (-) Transcript_47032:455-832(-)
MDLSVNLFTTTLPFKAASTNTNQMLRVSMPPVHKVKGQLKAALKTMKSKTDLLALYSDLIDSTPLWRLLATLLSYPVKNFHLAHAHVVLPIVIHQKKLRLLEGNVVWLHRLGSGRNCILLYALSW